MRIDSYLSAETFRRFTLFDILGRRKNWKSPVTFMAIMCACAVVCLFFRHVDGALLLMTVLLVVGLGMPVVYFVSFFASLAKQVKAQKLDPPRLVYSLDLSEQSDGIAIENGKEKAVYAWKDVYHVYDGKDCVYLFMTPERAFLLPHACVKEGRDALWSLIVKMAGKEKCSIV